MGRQMSLFYPPLEVGIFMISVMVTGHALTHEKSNWLFGSMFVTCYILVAIAIWYEAE